MRCCGTATKHGSWLNMAEIEFSVRRSSITRAAASAKVGTDGAGLRAASRASRFSATGSRPWATAVRLSWAMARALARLTAGYGPSPMSRRRPSMTIRWTHDLLPEGATLR